MRASKNSASHYFESHVAYLIPQQGITHYCSYSHGRAFMRDDYELVGQMLIDEEAKRQSI